MTEKTRDSLIVSGVIIATVNVLCLIYYSFADNEYLIMYLIMLGIPLVFSVLLALTEKVKAAYIYLWIIIILQGIYVIIPLMGVIAGLTEGLAVSAFSTLTIELIVFLIPCIIAISSLLKLKNNLGG